MKRISSNQLLDQSLLLDTVKEALLNGKQVKLQARGWSMIPLIWHERDTIILSPLTESSISVGRIVLAQTGSGKYVVHRIVRIVGTRVELRGDGNPYQEEYVHPDTIFGELREVIRDGRTIKLGGVFWNAVTYIWPRNSALRRILLYLYRIIVLRKTWEEMRMK